MASQEEDKSKLLRSLLENPALLQGALSLANSFLCDEEDVRSPASERRHALLLAVKPYLGQARQTHLETLLQILQIVEHLMPKGESDRETSAAVPSV